MSLQPNNIHTVATCASGRQESLKEQLLENSNTIHSDCAFSTSSFLSSTNQIQNPHLPNVYSSTLPTTTLLSPEHKHHFMSQNTQNIFLEAGMLVGAGQLVSLLPSVMQTDSANIPHSKRQMLPIDSRNYLQSFDENFQSVRDPNIQLTESQRFSISQSTISLQNDSPFPPLSTTLADPVSSSAITTGSTAASGQINIPFQLIYTHPQLQDFPAMSLAPSTPLCRPSQQPITATEKQFVDDAIPNHKMVNFHHLGHVVEIPSTPADLSSQFEQVSAEALNEVVIDE